MSLGVDAKLALAECYSQNNNQLLGELTMWYYHITSMENLPSILEHGLVPKIPNIATAPQIPMVYVSNSMGRLLDLREQQVEELDKQGNHVILQLWLDPSRYWLIADPDSDHDCWMTPSKIPPSQITVL